MPSRFTSTVKLYKVDEIQKGHLTAFSSQNNQTAFFEERKVQEIENCKIIRNAPTIRVNIPKSEIYGCNYVSFVNPDYGDKVFYNLVIGEPLYINDQCTELMITEDPIQTWMFDVDVDIYDTYIEREMLSQEKADIAADNPYDDDLWEFDTPEHLPVSPELELRQYDFDSYPDMEHRTNIRDSIAAKLFKSTGETTMTDVIIVSPIDWAKLNKEWDDDPAHTGQRPQDEWQDYVKYGSYNGIHNGVDYGSGHFVVTSGASPVIIIDGQPDNTKSLTNKYPTSCTIFVSSPVATHSLVDFLTRLNCVSSIVNVFKVPQNITDYALRSTSSVAQTLTFTPPDLSAYHNKKLARFPFSYFRLITPAGDVAEFKYEYIESLRDGEGLYQLGVYADIINNITIYATPYDYQYKLISDSDIDPSVAVKFSQFPTAPLSIDAYLAQLSATAAQLRSTATQTRNMQFASDLNQLSYTTNPLYNAAEAVSSVGGAAAGMVSQTVGGMDFSEPAINETKTLGINPVAATLSVAKNTTGIINSALAQGKRGADKQILEHQAAVIRNAKTFLLSGDTGGAFSQEYSASRVAYAADRYVPPRGPGFEHYADFGWLNIGMVKVQLREEILQRYDDYFSSYGFTSGRIGKPYLMYFIKGNQSSNSLPEWINGQTYCKTYESHVIAPYQYVADVWQAAFNSGTHWINGDDLITPLP